MEFYLLCDMLFGVFLAIHIHQLSLRSTLVFLGVDCKKLPLAFCYWLVLLCLFIYVFCELGMIMQRLKYLRDMLNGDLPINKSIDIHQLIETLNAVIKELEEKGWKDGV